MKNILVDTLTQQEDDMRRVIRLTVTDLESNVTYNADVNVEKTVERVLSENQRADRDIISQRKNSYGKTVCLVRATEDEFQNKYNAAISKALRNAGLRIIPGDIQEECTTVIMETLERGATENPTDERKKIADAFARLGVLPEHLAQFLGHSIEQTTPKEIVELRQIWLTIKDGEAKWSDYVDGKTGEVKQDKVKTGVDAVKERLQQLKEKA